MNFSSISIKNSCLFFLQADINVIVVIFYEVQLFISEIELKSIVSICVIYFSKKSCSYNGIPFFAKLLQIYRALLAIFGATKKIDNVLRDIKKPNNAFSSSEFAKTKKRPKTNVNPNMAKRAILLNKSKRLCWRSRFVIF